MTIKSVAISSGHGKYIRGASGKNCGSWGLDEVDEARRQVAQLANELKRRGVTVYGPFNDDTSHDQNTNLNTIVNWHNKQPPHDLDISCHFNANACTANPMGCEVLYVSQEDLARKTSAAIAKAGKFKDRGPKYRSDLFVLNNTKAPAILTETCFVDSSTDAKLWRQNYSAVCSAMADAISGVTAEQPLPPEQPPAEADIRPVIGLGEVGDEVFSIQQSLGIPADGYFGKITEAAVKGFQRAHAVPGGADGVVGEATWATLDDLDARMAAGDDGISDELAKQIELIVDRSPLVGYVWRDRGQAPPGYYAGMAKVYALALTRLGADDAGAQIMAQADTGNPDKDALSWYADEFEAQEMDNSKGGIDTLRHLFVLMFGLGLRESGGNHWCGRDMSADNLDAQTCESGLFQSSWNLSNCSETIDDLLNEFEDDPNGFRPTFTVGLYPQVEDLDNYGSGDGCYYQWLAKFSPAFAALMTAIGLRKLRQHWGPINRREVEIVGMVDDLLIEVEKAMA